MIRFLLLALYFWFLGNLSLFIIIAKNRKNKRKDGKKFKILITIAKNKSKMKKNRL